LIYRFDSYSLDVERQELRCGADLVPVEPKVLDLLQYLILNRERVVSKDDLITNIWGGRIISESTLTSRIAATRRSIDDTGQDQRRIRTIARKGLRFVAEVREEEHTSQTSANDRAALNSERVELKSNSLGGVERRQLTIMACDFGVAAHSERLDPEDLHEVTTLCFGAVKNVVEGYGGYVAKPRIDGVLVYFGYPQTYEDDAERAVRAALAAIRSIAELKIECLSVRLHARAGIATGIVVVNDSISAGSLAEDGATGGTPHLAARLLSLADRDAVVVSESTRRLIGGLFSYVALSAARFMVDADTAEAVVVAGENASVSRFEALRSVETELTGREEELELLLRRWSVAKTGEGRVVLVWGEAGVGKSRLATALQDAIKFDQHSSVSLFCAPHRAQTALYPVISELERAAQFEPNDSDAIKLTKLEALLGTVPEDAIVLLADLLSVPTNSRYPVLSLSPQRRKELVFERVINRVTSLASRRPLLLILEDAHWIDPTSRELFDVLVERIRGVSILVLITYRPEFAPSWMGQSHVSVLTLNRLGPRESALMIGRVAGRKTLPSEVLNQVAKRTEGMPLFIEEMTKSVLESHLLDGDSAFVGAGSGGVQTLAVPATLQASLVARLDRIAPVRAVAQAGAALGREFSYATLKAVLGLDDSELVPLVERLVISGLVHQRGAVPDCVYTFKHALVQDAVYETLLKSQRIELQKRVVAVLEEEFPAIAERNPDVLAHHCAEARLWEKAIAYRLRSARSALDHSAPLEAQLQTEIGAHLLPKVKEETVCRQLEGCLQTVTGNTLAMTKGFASPEVAAALSRALRLLDTSMHRAESLHALGGLFQYHLIRSESPKTLALVRPYLRRSLDEPTAMVIAFITGTANLHIGKFQPSRDNLEKARSLYDEEACRPIAFAGGPHIGSFTLIWLALAYLYLGLIEEAQQTISAAIQDARTRLHPFTLVSALLAQARFMSHTGDLEGAIAATEEGLAIAIEQRSPYHVARAGILQAWNVVEGGDAQEGITLMERALARQRETGGNFLSSYNLSRLAQAHARSGNVAKALKFGIEGAEEVQRTGELWWMAEAERIKGEILLLSATRNRREAEACFLRALRCARSQGAKLWEVQSATSLARLWRQTGRSKDAKELLKPLCEAFPATCDLAPLIDARVLLEQA
jgi:DNA-binding winged helix-turn-helix (wHTH) protein/tetratricopeptide (TPR) repeat protein